MTAPAPCPPFAAEVRAGLGAPGQKTLPCHRLYDAVGTALFRAICALPEYGLTRADDRLLRLCAPSVAGYAGPRASVVELGSGDGVKTRHVLAAFGRRVPYYPVDVSSSALEECQAALRDVGAVAPLHASYLDGLRAAAARRRRGRLLVLFLGSTIGNFDRGEAPRFLRSVRDELRPGDALLVGADLVKPEPQLLAAYDDPAGVTAAFNRNLLARINRELGADFDLRSFAHEARYSRPHRRIEMHLRSQADQQVRIPGASIAVAFRRGETIWTESSHKFQAAEIPEMAAVAGFACHGQWTDEEWPFAETLLIAR